MRRSEYNTAMALKTWHGSCDCGRVKFEVDMDLDAGTFKCNCKICWKYRFWGAMVKSDAIRLLSGEGELTAYGGQRLHYFCRHCGIKLFGRSADGLRVAVSLAALDDLDPQVLAKAPVRYVDGLHDNFTAVPDFKEQL